MTPRGFSVLELLIALTISALLVGAVATALVPARAALETTPAAIDLQQRLRIAAEVMASTIRSAGIHDGRGSPSPVLDSVIPAVLPVLTAGSSLPNDVFSEIVVTSMALATAHGVLQRDQPSATSALTLASGPGCSPLPDVCGLVAGTIAAISDGQGRFDIFEVSLADAARMTLTPVRALSVAYPAGAQVVEAESWRFSLAPQSDGSKALVRTTAAGSSQPIADGLTSLSFSLWGEASAPEITWDGEFGWASYGPKPPLVTWRDPRGAWPAGQSCMVGRDPNGPHSRLTGLGGRGTLVPLTRTMLQDGPWCFGPAGGVYDADLFRLRRVDISFGLEAMAPALRGSAGQLFHRAGSNSRAPIRWVPDRSLTTAVFLRNER